MKKTLAVCLSLMLTLALTLSVLVFATDDNTDTTLLTDDVAHDDAAPADDGAALPFEDVAEDIWYYSHVKAAFEGNLIQGMSDTSFGPDVNLSVAQAITFAVRMHVYFTEDAVAVENATEGNWYDSYVDYAIENEIIAEDTFENYTDAATRAQMAFLFVKAVPEMAVLNADAAAPDVEENEYAEFINALYVAGIVNGMDEEGSFNPDSNIKRSEVAAILNRLVNENVRIGAPEVGDNDAGDTVGDDGTVLIPEPELPFGDEDQDPGQDQE